QQLRAPAAPGAPTRRDVPRPAHAAHADPRVLTSERVRRPAPDGEVPAHVIHAHAIFHRGSRPAATRSTSPTLSQKASVVRQRGHSVSPATVSGLFHGPMVSTAMEGAA